MITREQGYIRAERPAKYSVGPGGESDLLEKLVEECHAARCQNVLVLGSDIRIRLSTMDVLELGAEIADTRLNIAVVETHNAAQEDVD